GHEDETTRLAGSIVDERDRPAAVAAVVPHPDVRHEGVAVGEPPGDVPRLQRDGLGIRERALPHREEARPQAPGGEQLARGRALTNDVDGDYGAGLHPR